MMDKEFRVRTSIPQRLIFVREGKDSNYVSCTPELEKTPEIVSDGTEKVESTHTHAHARTYAHTHTSLSLG